MKPRKNCFLLTAASALLLMPAAHAINWEFGGVNNLWSNPDNWVGDVVPNSNTVEAAFVGSANVAIDVDADFTIRNYLDGFGGEGFTHTLFGAGTLTIDRNSTTTQLGINNATGDSAELPEDPGGTLRLNGFVTINNTLGGVTTIQNSNSANNTLLFDTNSNLKLITRMQTNTGSGGTINFNGNLIAGSTANLLINSNNVFFGTGHLSTNFGNDIVFLANSKLTVNGGTVLNTGRKFQVNGSGAELELNAADAINDANVIVGGSNNFLVDVNENQASMGVVSVTDGILTIDVDPAVTNLSFGKSSGQVWGSGSVTINGFKENTIRFGEDDTGLSAGQLAVIDGGIYTLTPTGFLTASPAGGDFASWADDNGIPGETFDDDFNNDGISNGVAYALGLSPTESSQPAGVLTGSTITFTKGADAIANADVTWIIETSETLSGTWLEEVTQPAGDATATISYDLNPVPGTPKKFARLKVVQVP
ncbi:MAG TPA: hypothetical protein VLO11_08340 [Luteolibacter sp.]|nr:hypothetical protein [Luteolibacter sp.]